MAIANLFCDNNFNLKCNSLTTKTGIYYNNIMALVNLAGNSNISITSDTYTTLTQYSSVGGILKGGITLLDSTYLIIPRAGKYFITVTQNFSASTAGLVNLIICVNDLGGGQLSVVTIPTSSTTAINSGIYDLALNDKISVKVYQNTGTNMTAVIANVSILDEYSCNNGQLQLFYIGE